MSLSLEFGLFCHKNNKYPLRTMRTQTFLLALLLFCCAPFVGVALSGAEPGDELYEVGSSQVQAELLSNYEEISSAAAELTKPIATLGVRLKIEKGWHVYWRNSGEAGIPTRISWTLPPGLRAEQTLWPIPTRFEEAGGITTFGYSNDVILLSRLYRTAENLEKGPLQLKAEVKWLACRDICVPGKALLEKTITAGPKNVVSREDAQLISSFESQIPEPFPTGAPPQELRSIGLSPLSERTTVAPGNIIEAGLLIERVPEIADPNAHLQIFPYENKELTTGNPQLAALNTQELPIAKNSFLVLFPLEAQSGAKLGTHSVKGILVFSAAMLGRSQNAALEWELPVTISREPSQINEGFVQLKNSISSSLPLLCSYQSYKNEVSEESVLAKNENSELGLLLSLLFGFIGGILLNLMPCVLPIISIKLVGFVQQGEQSRRETLLSALFFALGIIFSFLSLALVVTLLRSANKRIGWGFQFQHPEFVLVMIVVVFLLALGFFDIYTVSLPFMREAERRVSALRHRFLKSFFEGVLTTALSTPCTAPLLGTALVYAFTQETLDTFLIFLAVGLGLSLPYVILSTNKRFLSLLPKPGAWMTRFKELMGFLLLATVIWLLYVLHKSSPEAVIWTLALLLLILFTFWAYGWAASNLSRKSRWIIAVVFCSILLWFVSQLLPFVERRDAKHKIAVPSGSLGWEEYSPEHVNALLSQGRTVFLNFTADWCLTCKANELLVLRRNEVKRIFAEFNVAPVKADWTNGNEEITTALERYGAKGVPFYVVLAPDNNPENNPNKKKKAPLVLGTLLTLEKLREAVRQTTLK